LQTSPAQFGVAIEITVDIIHTGSGKKILNGIIILRAGLEYPHITKRKNAGGHQDVSRYAKTENNSDTK
jgi:hypothetical protein